MSMLAEVKKKRKLGLNPRGNLWAHDENKLGQKILEKMGWAKGKGLGKNEQGCLEPIRVSKNSDNEGVGYKSISDDGSQHYESFEDVLTNLNSVNNPDVAPEQNWANGESSLDNIESLEIKSKKLKSRVHYKKFTQGKDMSRYNDDDLACVLGSKKSSKKKNYENVTNETHQEPTMEVGQMDKSYGLTSYYGGNLKDYFIQKMAELKRKREEGLLGDGTGSSDFLTPSQSKKQRLNSVPSTPFPDLEFEPERTEFSFNCSVQETEPEPEPAPQSISPELNRKKKKKRRSKERDLEAEAEAEVVLDENEKVKEKRKKDKKTKKGESDKENEIILRDEKIKKSKKKKEEKNDLANDNKDELNEKEFCKKKKDKSKKLEEAKEFEKEVNVLECEVVLKKKKKKQKDHEKKNDSDIEDVTDKCKEECEVVLKKKKKKQKDHEEKNDSDIEDVSDKFKEECEVVLKKKNKKRKDHKKKNDSDIEDVTNKCKEEYEVVLKKKKKESDSEDVTDNCEEEREVVLKKKKLKEHEKKKKLKEHEKKKESDSEDVTDKCKEECENNDNQLLEDIQISSSEMNTSYLQATCKGDKKKKKKEKRKAESEDEDWNESHQPLKRLKKFASDISFSNILKTASERSENQRNGLEEDASGIDEGESKPKVKLMSKRSFKELKTEFEEKILKRGKKKEKKGMEIIEEGSTYDHVNLAAQEETTPPCSPNQHQKQEVDLSTLCPKYDHVGKETSCCLEEFKSSDVTLRVPIKNDKNRFIDTKSGTIDVEKLFPGSNLLSISGYFNKWELM